MVPWSKWLVAHWLSFGAPTYSQSYVAFKPWVTNLSRIDPSMEYGASVTLVDAADNGTQRRDGLEGASSGTSRCTSSRWTLIGLIRIRIFCDTPCTSKRATHLHEVFVLAVKGSKVTLALVANRGLLRILIRAATFDVTK